MIKSVIPTAAGKSGSASVRAAVAQEAFRDREALFVDLDTSAAGLDEEQIAERLDRDGNNEVSHEKPPHWARQLLRAFKNPFIIVLLVLAVVQIFACSSISFWLCGRILKSQGFMKSQL